jgi:hypothetical protein
MFESKETEALKATLPEVTQLRGKTFMGLALQR